MIKRAIKFGKDGVEKIEGPGNGRDFVVDYASDWELVSRHRKWIVEGLRQVQHRNKSFVVPDRSGGQGLTVELSIYASKWDLQNAQSRGYSGVGKLSSLAGPAPTIVVEELAKLIAKRFYYWWHVRLTIGHKQWRDSGWKLVDSAETVGGTKGGALSWDELSYTLENHWGH